MKTGLLSLSLALMGLWFWVWLFVEVAKNQWWTIPAVITCCIQMIGCVIYGINSID